MPLINEGSRIYANNNLSYALILNTLITLENINGIVSLELFQ